MAMSNKEIIKHLPDWIAEKKTSFFFGSGTSAPGMPLMNDYDPKDLLEEVVQRNKALIAHDPALFIEWVESKDSRWNSPLKKEYNHFCGQGSVQAVQDFVETKFHEIQSTANEYKCFMNNILSMLNNVNSRELHKNINIFLQIMIYSLKKQLMKFMKKEGLFLLYLMMVPEDILRDY